MTKNILVVGAGGNAGMNFTKSLHLSREPYNIYGADIRTTKLRAVNHLYKQVFTIPRINERKHADILSLVAANNIDMIHPQPDAEVMYFLKYDKVFEKYIFPHDYIEALILANKYEVQNKANSTKFKRMRYLDFFYSKQQKEDFDSMKYEGRVWVRAIRGAGSRAALPVGSVEQAHNWVNYWVEFKGYRPEDFMLAQYLPGREFAVQTFWSNGKLIHSQARERIEYFFNNVMPSEQSSTPSIATVTHDFKILDAAHEAIYKFNNAPNGIYCVDIKEDHNGNLIILEINYGRFFTTNDFLARCGVNTPNAYVQKFLFGNEDIQINTARHATCYRGLDMEPTIDYGPWENQ